MFLIQNDQTQPWRRREGGGAGAEQDDGLATLHGEPGPATLGVGQGRVQHRQRRCEPLAKARLQLRSQVDFGQQQHDLLTPGEHFLGQAQIDFGLAAAGHALQQESPVVAEGLNDRRNRLGLRRVESRRLDRRHGGHGRRERIGSHGAPLGQALVDQRPGAGAEVTVGADQVLPDQSPGILAQQLQQFGLPGGAGQAISGVGGAGRQEQPAQACRRGRLALAQQHRQGRGHHLADRVVVITTGPVQQFQIGRAQQRAVVEDRAGRPEFFGRQIGGRGHPQQDADLAVTPEGHLHALSRFQSPRVDTDGRQVIEGPVHGRRHGNLKYGRHLYPDTLGEPARRRAGQRPQGFDVIFHRTCG